MKESVLRKLIREQIRKVLKENSAYSHGVDSAKQVGTFKSIEDVTKAANHYVDKYYTEDDAEDINQFVSDRADFVKGFVDTGKKLVKESKQNLKESSIEQRKKEAKNFLNDFKKDLNELEQMCKKQGYDF